MKLTTEQLKQIIKEELNKLVLKESGGFTGWLKSQNLYNHFISNNLMTQPGMLEFLTTMMRQGLEVVKQGPKAMTFQRMSNDGDEQTVVYLGPDVLLYLSENANPITYGSALEASRQIPQELNPPAVDFGNLF